METSAKHIMFIRTSSMAYVFLRGQVTYLRAAGYEVTFVSAPGPGQAMAEAEGAHVASISLHREPSPFHDLMGLWRLWRIIRAVRPDLITAGTPKAGLLGSVAARAAGVPIRVYALMGLRLETLTGMRRQVSVWLERIACACSDSVLCVSPSLRDRAIAERLARPEKLIVLGPGSSSGVNLARFAASPTTLAQAADVRRRLNIGDGDFVIGFVGRLVRDKGIVELLQAFQKVRETTPAKLVLVGEREEGTGNTLSAKIRTILESNEDIREVPFMEDPAPIYHLIDVLALPTYREGFPNVVLEAQASGRPVVTTDATGAVDSIVDGSTGWIVPVGNIEELAEALLRIARLPDRGRAMGRAGRARVETLFDQTKVWADRHAYFEGLLRAGTRQRGIMLGVKWVFDRFFALLLLLLLFPALLGAGLFVLLTLGWPVIFRQGRIGREGKTIYVHKFRTMSEERDASGTLLPDAQRLGRVGRMLRALSIDELPQLWDVVRGVLSFVGPRPLLERYRDRYNAEQWRRHNVFPGISGWAQIHGRNAITWEEKFDFDIWYVDHWSFGLDLRILALTLWRTVRREGISYPSDATMPEFQPSSKTKSAHE